MENKPENQTVINESSLIPRWISSKTFSSLFAPCQNLTSIISNFCTECHAASKPTLHTHQARHGASTSLSDAFFGGVLSPCRALWTSCKIEFSHSFVFMWTSQALHCQSAQLAPKAEAKMFSNSNIFFTQALVSITLLLLYVELKCLPVVEIKIGKKAL